MIRPAAVMLLALLLTGCSTLETGSLQDITLTTPGASDTRCFIRNSRFLYVINPPRRFEIEKSDLPYTVTCLAPGNRRKTITLPSTYNTRSNQNLYNGYLPGAAVDLASGALFSYPDQVIVDFTGMPPRRMPLPDYQVMMDENPLMRGMEEFRPGDAALQSDQNQVIEPMQKRPPGSMDDTFGTVMEPGESNVGDAPAASATAAQATPQAPAGHSSVFTGTSSSSGVSSNASGATTSGTSGQMKHTLPSWNDAGGSGESSSSSGFAGGTASPAANGITH